MALTSTPICAFGKPAPDFDLLGVDQKHWTLEKCKGEKGLLVMFICNHCPYVKAVQTRLVKVTRRLMELGIGCVAISSNDPIEYPEDSFENMKKIAKQKAYPFPYLWDETQAVAKGYGAICTPDFFGYNRELKLQYRGRLDAGGLDELPVGSPCELVEAMRLVATTGKGPENQIPSMGCSIKWKS